MGQELLDDADMLRGIVDRLSAATAEAGATVQMVDHFLAEELCLGLSAASRPFDSQRLRGDDNAERIVSLHLAFGRVQGQDRLYVLRATHETSDGQADISRPAAEERIPWSACPREVRLQSFARLPELLAALATRAQEVSQQTSRTIDVVRTLIEAMRTLPGREIAGEEGPEEPSPPPPDEAEPDEPRAVALQELSAGAAPSLFKRPRVRS